MAFQRRAGNRFTGSIWPGFVDAITSLLMVMIFVLTIFMVVQYVLREEITNQDDELNALNAQLNDLSEALGLEATRADRLESRVATLTGSLSAAEARAAEQDRHFPLTAEGERQAAAIASFEEQVAALLAENTGAWRGPRRGGGRDGRGAEPGGGAGPGAGHGAERDRRRRRRRPGWMRPGARRWRR
jgi:chemotaxis protein MotB